MASRLPGISVGLGLESTQFETGMRRADQQMAQFANRTTRVSRQMRGAFTNVGFQVQDLAVQLASGTGAVRALSQQLPQLLSGFGGVGIAIGTVVAIAGAAAPALLGMRDGTRDADQAAKSFAETQTALKNLLDDSSEAIRNQAAEISRLTGASRELGLESLELQLVQTNQGIRTETEALRATLAELESSLLQPSVNEIAGRGPILEALAAVHEARTRDDPAALAGSIAKLMRQMGDPALLEFQARVVRGGATIQDLASDAAELERSIADANKGVVLSTKELAEQGKAAATAAKGVAELTSQQARLARAGQFLTRTSAQEQRFDHFSELQREQQRLLDREADETAKLLAKPFDTAAASAESAFKGSFSTILQDGEVTFESLGRTARGIFADLASELVSSAVFRPESLIGLFGTGTAAAGTAGSTVAGSAGPIVLPGGTGATGPSTGATAAGGVGGAALAAAPLASAQPYLAAALALIGTALTVYSATSGGSSGPDESSGTAGGGLGNIGVTGRNAFEVKQLLKNVDQDLLDLLNSRQEAIADEVLRKRSVDFAFNGLTGDVADFLTTSRIRPVAQALGFSRVDSIKELGSALEAQEAIQLLTRELGQFDLATQDLEDTFSGLTRAGERYGIALEGLVEAQEKAAADLLREQDAQLRALIDPFDALQAPLDALIERVSLDRLAPGARRDFIAADLTSTAAEALAGSTDAIASFDDIARQFLASEAAFGASPGLAAAQSQVLDLAQQISAAVGDARDSAVSDSEILTAIERASRDQTDTLRELVVEVRDAVAALRRRI